MGMRIGALCGVVLLLLLPRAAPLRRGRAALTASAGMEHFKRIILIRHGAVDRSAADIKDGAFYGGNVDLPLSTVGKGEAIAAAEYLVGDMGLVAGDVGSLWSSPMRRARYGAEKVVEKLGGDIDIQVDEGYREINRGVWTNMTIAEIEAPDSGIGGPGAMDRFVKDIHNGGDPSEGESLEHVRRRVLESFRTRLLPSTHLGSTAILVSHLWVTRSVLTHVLHSDDFAGLDVPTASISIVDIVCDADGEACVDSETGRLIGKIQDIGIKPDAGGMRVRIR